MDDVLGRSLQENLLVLLTFSESSCKFIRNTVDKHLFETPYDDFVRRIFTYIDNYKEPPALNVADLVEDVLMGDDAQKKELYTRVLSNLIENRESVSEKFTLDRLDTFVRQQNLKIGILAAAELLNTGRDAAADEAEAVLQSYMKKRLQVFDIGTRFDSNEDALAFLTREKDIALPMNIKQLDDLALGPRKGGLHLFVGPAKSGKSTYLVHLGRACLQQGYKVVYITLEMPEHDVTQRFVQSMCGLTRQSGQLLMPYFVRDSRGVLQDIDFRSITPAVSMQDHDCREQLLKKLSRWKMRRRSLIVKQFPTSQLSIRGLTAYLDRLEESASFRPNLVIVDYADLMTLDAKNLRLDLGQLYKELRGVAVERDVAIATATQSNREGVKSGKVTETSVSEDFSKIATADCVLAFNRTELERKLKLGRILVAAARHNVDKFEVLITQNYEMAQFARDSIELTSTYSEQLGTFVESYDTAAASANGAAQP